MHDGTGPLGTNSERWRDASLRFGAQSSSLRDETTALISTVAKETVP